MADISVAKVKIKRSAPGGAQWRAVSYGANGEPIAWTESYARYEDAEAAAHTISEGAMIEREDDAWPEAAPPPALEDWPTPEEGREGAADSKTANDEG